MNEFSISWFDIQYVVIQFNKKYYILRLVKKFID